MVFSISLHAKYLSNQLFVGVVCGIYTKYLSKQLFVGVVCGTEESVLVIEVKSLLRKDSHF